MHIKGIPEILREEPCHGAVQEVCPRYSPEILREEPCHGAVQEIFPRSSPQLIGSVIQRSACSRLVGLVVFCNRSDLEGHPM